MSLTKIQISRYSRHIIIPEIGQRGQEKLLAGKVLIVGAGGLGSPCALYLAAAGVGSIGIVDPDTVELSNLQRQILHSNDTIGKAKTESAHVRLSSLNPEIRITPHTVCVDCDTIEDLVSGYDVVVECSDNFDTKYLVNDTCVRMKKPLVLGAVLRFQGKVMTILSHTACFRCAVPVKPQAGQYQHPAEAGILGAIAGLGGTIQATEVVKYLTGAGTLLTNRLLIFDGLNWDFRNITVSRVSACSAVHSE